MSKELFPNLNALNTNPDKYIKSYNDAIIIANSPLIEKLDNLNANPDKYANDLKCAVQEQEIAKLAQQNELRQKTFDFLTKLLSWETIALFFIIFLSFFTFSITKGNLKFEIAIDKITLDIVISATIMQITGMFFIIIKYLFK